MTQCFHKIVYAVRAGLSGLAVLAAVSAYSTPSSADSLKLVELFTSHGCSSCPPAEQLLAELLEDHEQLLALEFHVDYWNSLVHGSDGSFTDPFSDAAYSARQREYNVAGLQGRPGVYTPQAVINGRVAAVGSNRQQIERALADDPGQALGIQFEDEARDNSLRVQVTGSLQKRSALEGTAIRLVHYIDSATTKISGGENRHLELKNHHIVSGLQTLGAVSSNEPMAFVISKPEPGSGCVVLIQEDALTPVYAAQACP